ncbi:MAG: hypothetical protein HQ542_10150 [Bacteroidia bacterium]|nr:hypothetical protein [Bacteroidia bacterium]
MKKRVLFTLLLVGILFATCSKKEEEPTVATTDLAKVGNTWSGSIGINPTTVTIVSSDNGIVSVTVAIFDTTYTIKGKLTANEIADFVYSEGDEECPYTLVKFDANVGDEYIYNKGPLVVTRTVLEKDVQLPVAALGLTVNCFVVEEIIPEGLILLGQSVVGSKIKYWINHKYGIVKAELTTIWGTDEPVTLGSTNVGG